MTTPTVSMSGDTIYVNYANVQNVYQSLVDADNSINMVMNELETTIAGLVQTWSGESQAEYQTVQTYWNAQTTDMQNILSKFHGTLDEMTINYGNTDNNLAMQWSEIH